MTVVNATPAAAAAAAAVCHEYRDINRTATFCIRNTPHYSIACHWTGSRGHWMIIFSDIDERLPAPLWRLCVSGAVYLQRWARSNRLSIKSRVESHMTIRFKHYTIRFMQAVCDSIPIRFGTLSDLIQKTRDRDVIQNRDVLHNTWIYFFFKP